MSKLRKLAGILIIISVLSLLAPTITLAVPQYPMQFYGNAYIEGVAADDGTVVQAKINGVVEGETTVKDGKYGYDPTFLVDADDPDTTAVEGGVDGDTIVFYLGDAIVAEASFESGGDANLDLYGQDSTAPEVALTSPNGGETWETNSTEDITWSATDDNLSLTPITLEYYDGTEWVEIATDEANDGSYSWTLPADEVEECKVRITATDLAGNSGSDESDASFSIYALDEATDAGEVMAAETISPDSESVVETEDGKISIKFPAGSVLAESEVTIKKQTATSVPTIPSSIKAGATFFSIDLDGEIAPGAEITITITYSDEDVAAAGGDPELLALSRYDEDKGEWVVLPTIVDTEAKTLTVTTSEFSMWMTVVTSPSSFPVWLLVLLIVLGVLLIAGGAFYFLKIKQKSNTPSSPEPSPLP